MSAATPGWNDDTGAPRAPAPREAPAEKRAPGGFCGELQQRLARRPERAPRDGEDDR
jgi:hypothetical protein